MSHLPPDVLRNIAASLVAANSRPQQGNNLARTLLGRNVEPVNSSLFSHGFFGTDQNALSRLASLGAANANQSGAKWIYVTERFKVFQSNLKLTESQLTDGIRKFKGVVSCLNSAYWGINSDTANAFLIGSWAKDTQIRPPRDVDLYFQLPINVYKRFEAYGPNINKQSALLQEVKAKLLGTYQASDIKGDGPVVLAGFTSYNVEIVPAFLYDPTERSYAICDTKNGGKYIITKPLHEVGLLQAADLRHNQNVRRLIRMLKCWQYWCTVPIKSFHLELLAIRFLDQWQFSDKGYFFHDWMCRDFFSWLLTPAASFIIVPGTLEVIWLSDRWKSKAQSAYDRSAKACQFESVNNMTAAGDEWQKIFGTDIPKWL
ncbi:MAG: SMODS domain-containing nucleotidyltransferase [Pseudomonadota bacterium]